MRYITCILLGAALCLTACKGKDSKDKEAPKAATPEDKATPTEKDPAQTEADKKKAEEEKKKAEQTQRIADRIKKFEEEAKKEAERWTDDVKAKVAALVDADYPNAKAALTAIQGGPHRTPDNVARDPFRHPVETLTFFGIKPDMTVIEVGAGGGWYSEFLSPMLAKKGQFIAVTYDPKGPKDSFRTAYGRGYELFIGQSDKAYGKAKLVYVAPPDKLALGDAESVDLAIAIREMHNWHRGGNFKKYATAVHSVLKPGGVFGVVQHRAAEGANPDESAKKGYLPEKWLVEQLEAVGFKLEGNSDINNNAKDTKDYKEGVWTLPPTYALKDTDRAKYEAIGESDRMTLKFVKPKK